MKSRITLPMLSLAFALSLLAPASASSEEGVLVGDLTREKIEAAHPDWVQAAVESQPKSEPAHALAGVEPGAEVLVFLGTWCGDSRREVPRLWQSLDEAGGSVPFSLHYVGVDRQKKEPAAELEKYGIHYLPTFIVLRGGHEAGRIVETSPHGVEADLLALLTGKASGVLATREDLAPPSHP